MFHKTVVCLLISILDFTLHFLEFVARSFRTALQSITATEVVPRDAPNSAIALIIFVVAGWATFEYVKHMERGQALNMAEVDDWHAVVK